MELEIGLGKINCGTFNETKIGEDLFISVFSQHFYPHPHAHSQNAHAHPLLSLSLFLWTWPMPSPIRMLKAMPTHPEL